MWGFHGGKNHFLVFQAMIPYRKAGGNETFWGVTVYSIKHDFKKVIVGPAGRNIIYFVPGNVKPPSHQLSQRDGTEISHSALH
jgi:hypothetical protein